METIVSRVTVTKFSIGKSINGSRSPVRLELTVSMRHNIITLLPVGNRVVATTPVGFRSGQGRNWLVLRLSNYELYWITVHTFYSLLASRGLAS